MPTILESPTTRFASLLPGKLPRSSRRLDSLIIYCRDLRNMRLNGNNYTIKDTVIDAETTGGFPFNTDGFDVA